MATKVRVLVTLYLEGQEYPANTVLLLEDKQAKALEKELTVDSAPEAVAYCTDVLGKSAIKHLADAPEQPAA